MKSWLSGWVFLWVRTSYQSSLHWHSSSYTWLYHWLLFSPHAYDKKSKREKKNHQSLSRGNRIDNLKNVRKCSNNWVAVWSTLNGISKLTAAIHIFESYPFPWIYIYLQNITRGTIASPVQHHRSIFGENLSQEELFFRHKFKHLRRYDQMGFRIRITTAAYDLCFHH